MFLSKPIKDSFVYKIVILFYLSFVVCSVSFSQGTKSSRKIKKAEALYQKSLVLADSAKYDSAIVLLNEATQIYFKKKKYDKYIHCKNEIVKQSRNLKFNDELLVNAKENAILAIKMLGKGHYITGNSISLVGNIFADIKQTDSALFYFKKAMSIWESDSEQNKMRIASANLNIGQMLRDKGDFYKAAAFMNLALLTNIDSLGENHPNIAQIHNGLGVLYYYKGDIDSSAFYLTKVLEIREKCFGESHPQVANAYNNIGVIYKVKGDLEKALGYYEKSLKIREKIYTSKHPNLALSYSNIGNIYSDLGKYKIAGKYYDKALKMRLDLFGENHLDVAACYTNIGINCLNTGEGGNAIIYTQKAFKIILNLNI